MPGTQGCCGGAHPYVLMASLFRSVARSYAPSARDQGAVPVRCCLPGPSADVSNLGQGQSLPRWPWCLRVCARAACEKQHSEGRTEGRRAEPVLPRDLPAPGGCELPVPAGWCRAVPWCWQRGHAVGQGPGAVPGPGLVS